MTQFGPAAQSGCRHEDGMSYHELGGVAFRSCDKCGLTHTLWQFANGRMGLIEVEVFGPEKWAEVEREHAESAEEEENALSDVPETLSEVSADAGERPVSAGPDTPRWKARLVPVVRSAGEHTGEAGAAQEATE